MGYSVVDEDGSLLSPQPFAQCEEQERFLFVKKRNHGWTMTTYICPVKGSSALLSVKRITITPPLNIII